VEAALLDINVLQKIIILGNSMQSLGAGLQAYQGVSNVLKDERENEDSIFDKKDQRIIALIGIWIQVIGTLISAIGVTAIEEENRLENNEKSEILI
ncbi:AraC family transcriptional regulator, partial [Bacillus cereus]